MKLRYPKTREEFNELVAYLQAKHSVMELCKGTEHINGQPLPLFRNHPPEVQAQARVNLAWLMNKHRIKYELKGYRERNFYFGILVATATSMAKRQLGLAKVTWADAGRACRKKVVRKSAVRTFLGLQEPLSKIGGYGTSRKNHTQKYNPTPLPNQVNQGDLTGV